MKRLVIIGGAGYIGSHLLDLVSQKDLEIYVLDCNYFGYEHLSDIYENNDNITMFDGDIRNTADVAGVMEGADCVIHLAGLVGDPACSLDEDVTWLHNIQSTNTIVDIANYYKVKRLIYASSCSVYGAAPSDVTLNEGSYLNPVSLYARTKIDSERIFLDKFDGCCTILRLATVFGASRRMRFDLVANLFTIQALKKGNLSVFGGTQYRPFIHCEDAAKAFLHIMEYENESHIDRQVYNVSCANTNIRSLASLISDYVPDIKMKFSTTTEDDRNYRVSAEKINWMLGYSPKHDLQSGISHMVHYIKAKGFDDWEENNLYYNHKVICMP